ncbi:MAG TPA: thioredoxin family protein [Spirochaetota bacterium]|nr:thioredoxin family protein [Spirochaetota bacterium]
MKKLKIIIPVVIALGIAALPQTRECDCGTPLAGLLGIFGCSDGTQPHSHENAPNASLQDPPAAAAVVKNEPVSNAAPEVTFVELGSVNCIPCKMMQPVMKAVEEKFGSRVRIVFYDVWTPEGRQDAMKYRIRAIPTQVFLDKNGNEFFRHEGFFPQAEVEKVLAAKGVR